jgi:exopolyphosphatase/guanosine-5'-triphosphate,3'-diphosphate pyrophosphatase
MDLSPETLSGMDDISKRRADVLPYAAAALLAVIDHCKAETIVVSAAGLREGALFARAGAAADDWDPLEASCWLLSYRGVRDAAFGREAAAFIAPVAETCDARVKRLIGAAAMCADLTWQRLPDERADAAFQELMAAPLADVDHEDRVLLAAMVFHRYAGANDSPDEDEVLALLDEADLADARRVGVALRLAATLSARAGGVLNQMRLVAEGGDLVLETTRETRDFLGGSVYKRGEQLAQLMGRNFAVR